LSNPDEKKRLEATTFLANLFLNSESNGRHVSAFLVEPILQALSLRLLDGTTEIKICAAGAIRNIAAHRDYAICDILIANGIYEALYSITENGLQQDIFGLLQEEDASEGGGVDSTTENLVMYYVQIVNATTNVFAASSQELELTGRFLTSVITASRGMESSGNASLILLAEACANLLFVVSDDSISTCKLIMLEYEHYRDFLEESLSRFSKYQTRIDLNMMSSDIDIYKCGLFVNIMNNLEHENADNCIKVIKGFLVCQMKFITEKMSNESSAVEICIPTLNVISEILSNLSLSSCSNLTHEVVPYDTSSSSSNDKKSTNETSDDLECFCLALDCSKLFLTLIVDSAEEHRVPEDVPLCTSRLLSLIGLMSASMNSSELAKHLTHFKDIAIKSLSTNEVDIIVFSRDVICSATEILNPLMEEEDDSLPPALKKHYIDFAKVTNLSIYPTKCKKNGNFINTFNISWLSILI